MRYAPEWLTARGFDGLYDTTGTPDECGCYNHDLYPCDKEWRKGRRCRPGYKQSDGTGIGKERR